MGLDERSFFHYLPYSEEDEKLGLVCTSAGSMEVPANTPYPPRENDHPVIFRPVARGRILPGYHIIYITRGRGTFEALEKTHTVGPGCVLFLMPGMWHRYQPDFKTGWHEYWVGFKGTFFEKLFDEGILSRDQVFFKAGLHNTMIDSFNLVCAESRLQKPLYQFRACSGIFSLITETLTLERRKEQPNHYEEIVNKARRLMQDNILGTINLSGISEQVGLCVSSLNEVFKTYTSMTPYQYFIQIKINMAESLLEREESVKKAAYTLGFTDQHYFSRLFKKKTGVSPSDWKEFLSRPEKH